MGDSDMSDSYEDAIDVEEIEKMAEASLNSGVVVEGKRDFDLEIVLEGTRNCKEPNDVINMEHYLKAFKELCRFFSLMGRIFSFIASELQEHITILKEHMNSKKGHHYLTVQSMIDYEKKKNLTHIKSPSGLTSGARNLLRLHMVLEFILLFMRKLSESNDEAKVSEMAGSTYDETLAKHHTWLLRKVAGVVVYTLPERKQLIDSMCKQDNAQVLELVAQVVDEAQPVYDIIQKLYEDENLLDIP